MVNKIAAAEFLQRGIAAPIFDVRSPGEFQNGHIPGAINLPLFENKEREIVGILYKNKGRQEAIRKGLEIVGPKLTSLVDEAIQLAKSGELLLHCWRGGMRSSSVAWLFEAAGLSVYFLEGGYKQYRKYIRENILQNHKLVVLGGLTGSGKTILIKALTKAGEPVVDLEGLANHRGSAFGSVGLGSQPSTEHFENLLFKEIQNSPDGSAIWVEDESRRIGEIFLPEKFHTTLRKSPVVFVKVSDDERRENLVTEYARQPHEELLEAVKVLSKRLGGLMTKQTLMALDEKDYGGVVDLLLPYYDKLYSYGVEKRSESKIYPIDLSQLSGSERITVLAKMRLQLETGKV